MSLEKFEIIKEILDKAHKDLKSKEALRITVNLSKLDMGEKKVAKKNKQNNNSNSKIEAYDEFQALYNKFATKLEKLGADDEMFTELSKLCNASRNIY